MGKYITQTETTYHLAAEHKSVASYKSWVTVIPSAPLTTTRSKGALNSVQSSVNLLLNAEMGIFKGARQKDIIVCRSPFLPKPQTTNPNNQQQPITATTTFRSYTTSTFLKTIQICHHIHPAFIIQLACTNQDKKRHVTKSKRISTVLHR